MFYIFNQQIQKLLEKAGDHVIAQHPDLGGNNDGVAFQIWLREYFWTFRESKAESNPKAQQLLDSMFTAPHTDFLMDMGQMVDVVQNSCILF